MYGLEQKVITQILIFFTPRWSEALRPGGVQPAEGAVDGHSSTVSTGVASAQVCIFVPFLRYVSYEIIDGAKIPNQIHIVQTFHSLKRRTLQRLIILCPHWSISWKADQLAGLHVLNAMYFFRMIDSYDSAIIPLGSDAVLRDRYLSINNPTFHRSSDFLCTFKYCCDFF